MEVYVLVMLCGFSRSFSVPVDIVIVQVQRWRVVGSQQVIGQVLLNGLSLTETSREADSIIQTMSADAHLPDLVGNHSVLRSRECILEGSQLHWTDRVFCDGKAYLTLDSTDTWTAHVPQALALKVLWDQDLQRMRAERMRLQEGCVKLMRQLRLSEEHSDPGTPLPKLLIPLLALLAFTGLSTISFLLSKYFGLRHPGGVIGSLVHYPRDMSETAEEMKGSGYRTL